MQTKGEVQGLYLRAHKQPIGTEAGSDAAERWAPIRPNVGLKGFPLPCLLKTCLLAPLDASVSLPAGLYVPHTMSLYGEPLPKGSVQLLRLLPHRDENARIKC